MSNQGRSPQPKQKILDEDKLVESLVVDPSALPDARVLAGFVGKGVRDGQWRLYLNPSLDDYLEFAEADVLHSQRLDGSDNPLGGTVVWVKRKAKLVRTKTTANIDGPANFLTGAITAAHLNNTPAYSPAMLNTLLRGVYYTKYFTLCLRFGYVG